MVSPPVQRWYHTRLAANSSSQCLSSPRLPLTLDGKNKELHSLEPCMNGIIQWSTDHVHVYVYIYVCNIYIFIYLFNIVICNYVYIYMYNTMVYKYIYIYDYMCVCFILISHQMCTIHCNLLRLVRKRVVSALTAR